VGSAIRVPPPPPEASNKEWEPDEALVEKLHAQYVEELKALFERHKVEAGYGDRTLEILAARGGHGGSKSKKA